MIILPLVLIKCFLWLPRWNATLQHNEYAWLIIIGFFHLYTHFDRLKVLRKIQMHQRKPKWTKKQINHKMFFGYTFLLLFIYHLLVYHWYLFCCYILCAWIRGSFIPLRTKNTLNHHPNNRRHFHCARLEMVLKFNQNVKRL